MTLVTITGDTIREGVGRKDNRPWYAWAADYQDGNPGVITPRRSKPLIPSNGVLTFEIEAGISAWIENPDGQRYLVTIPLVDGSLWEVIEAGVAYPPETRQQSLAAAVGQFILDHADELGFDDVQRSGTTLNFIRGGVTLGSFSIADLVFNGDMDDITDAGVTGKAVARSHAPGEVRQAINAHPLLPQGYFTAAGKADGALTTLDSGQSWSSFGNYPGAIVSGEVVHAPAVSGTSTAAYYQASTGDSRPTRILCKGYWPSSSGSDNAALTFVVPISAWGPPGGFPGDNAAQVVAGVHSTFFRNGIHKHSCWNVGSQTVYGDSEAAAGSNPALGRYAPVAVGESVWFEMWIDYDTGTITFYPPKGGKPFTIQDDAIKNDTGNWVVWEQFEYLGTDAGPAFVIEEMHFDTQVRRRDSFAATKLDIADLYPGLVAAGAEGIESTVASSGTKVLTADSPRVQVFTTGTTAHTVQLPAAVNSIQPMYIRNAITGGQLTVKDSTGATMMALTTGQLLLAIPLSLAPTTVGNWLYIAVVDAIGTQTLSATRVNPRVTSTATATSLTPSFATADVYKYTALASALTINAPGNTTDSHRQRIWIKDDGTSRALTWNAAYVAMPGVTLPTATTVGKWILVEYQYNSTASTAFVTTALVQP